MRGAPESEPELTTAWRAVTKCLVWAVVLVALCVGLALFKPQINRQARTSAKLEALKAEKNLAKDENRRVKAQLDWVKNDPAYLENFIRDRVGKSREGEWVMQFTTE